MSITKETEFRDHIEGSARALTTIAPLLPTLESVQTLIEQAANARSRGYFLPDEDEQVRIMFSHYLTTRAALVSVLEDLRPYVMEELKRPTPGQREVFLIAFCAACMLVRTGRFLVDTFRKNRFVVRKLDEAEPRFGIPPRQFTQIYRSLSSSGNVWVFLEAIRYFRQHKEEILALELNPKLKPVVELLRGEEPFIESSTMYYTKNRWKYRLHSFLRRHHSGFKKVTFGLFRISGSLISEMRNRWRRKRVTPVVQRKLSRMLKPGDVIITRHDEAASNLFLPGYWPHCALYIGTESQRRELDPSGVSWQREQCPDPNCVLEARKDGVLFRPIQDTLNVDACVVLRPKLPTDQICEAISRAMTHEGKRYDFEFDFRRSDKLVCTEVIYRAYHGIGDVEFELKHRRGRICLTSEDLLDYAIEGKFFDIICIYGSNGNRFVTEERARPTLIASYRSSL